MFLTQFIILLCEYLTFEYHNALFFTRLLFNLIFAFILINTISYVTSQNAKIMQKITIKTRQISFLLEVGNPNQIYGTPEMMILSISLFYKRNLDSIKFEDLYVLRLIYRFLWTKSIGSILAKRIKFKLVDLFASGMNQLFLVLVRSYTAVFLKIFCFGKI